MESYRKGFRKLLALVVYFACKFIHDHSKVPVVMESEERQWKLRFSCHSTGCFEREIKKKKKEVKKGKRGRSCSH
jgi:hypothetical protein